MEWRVKKKKRKLLKTDLMGHHDARVNMGRIEDYSDWSTQTSTVKDYKVIELMTQFFLPSLWSLQKRRIGDPNFAK